MQPFAGMQHLDVAGGTGDVAVRVLRAMQVCMANASMQCFCRRVSLRKECDCLIFSCVQTVWQGCLQADQARQQESSDSPAAVPLGHVHLCDINPGMLQEGYKKAAQNGLGGLHMVVHVFVVTVLPSSL